MWPKNASTSQITTYIFVTLFLSLGTALLLNHNSLKFGMFAGLWLVIPTMVAVTLNIMHHGGFTKVYSSVFNGNTRSAMVFAVLYPLGFVAVLAGLLLLFGQARVNTGSLPALSHLILSVISLLFAMIIAFGEEYGWRGFFLPALANRYSQTTAAIVTGLGWALYQLPPIYLGMRQIGEGSPLAGSLVQGALLISISFPLAYCYFLTKGSILPVMLVRAVFDVTYSLVLGSGSPTSPSLIAGTYTVFASQIPLELVVEAVAAIAFFILLRQKSRLGAPGK